MSAVSSTRQRTTTEITRDVLAACRRLGEIAMVSEMSLQAPDLPEIGRTVEGLQRVLIEYRAEGRQ